MNFDLSNAVVVQWCSNCLAHQADVRYKTEEFGTLYFCRACDEEFQRFKEAI